MREIKSETTRGVSSICRSALVGLVTLVGLAAANAQLACDPSILCGVSINPASGSQVVAGQTVTINYVKSGITAASCYVTNGDTWLAYPDGTTVLQTELNYVFNSVPAQYLCTGTAGGGGAPCLTFTTSYVVNTNDAGRTLQLGSPTVIPRKYAQNGNNPSTFPGIPNQIHFFAASEGDGYNDTSFTHPSGLAYGEGQVFLTLVYPGLTVTKVCDTNCFLFGSPISFHGSICNTGNVTLTSITVTDFPAGPVSSQSPITFAATTSSGRLFDGMLTNGECVGYTGSYTPAGTGAALCGPFSDTVVASGIAFSVFQNPTYSATNSATCLVCNNPGIAVTKACPPTLIQPGGTLTFTGTVTNTGNVPLTNVVIFNNRPSPGTLVFGPVTLAPGAGTNFTGSYVVPLDSCGPYVDTLTAIGAGTCAGSVTNTFTATCPGTNSPGIAVTKNCPANPVPPGGLLVISGVVSNTGNITLTNVTVTNVIAALGQTHLVLGPISLPPGGSVVFSDRYNVPLDTCGPYLDTVTASGADKCFGRVVTATDFKDCPGITTPRIAVFKHCPTNPVVPGGVAVFSGIVSNAGNITLTNVFVVNDRPTNNTPVFGPVTLAPGQATNFTGSELVPSNCCSYFDTLAATGTSMCTGSNVMATATAVCPTVTTPRLTVTKNCPPNPVPLGQPLFFTGTVSNAGNITLTGVTVVDNQPTNNTPVLGPITLVPGQSAGFMGSFIVPTNICDTNIADTVTARGTDICTGSNATASATAVCPIVAVPALTVTKQCPANPVPPGGLLVYSGIVSNSGTLTLTNVTVVDDRPTPNTPVVGPIVLAPGQFTNFTGAYIMPFDCCGPCVDTLTAQGQDFCVGSNVVATASDACPRITTPGIAVTRDCPLGGATLGDLAFFSGMVSNSGNATLGNVVVIDDQAGAVLDNIALAPGEGVAYFGMYILTNCGPGVASTVTAFANDVCTGVLVSNRFVTACSIGCPQIQPVTIAGPILSGGYFLFSFPTQLNRNYTVEFTDLLVPANWQPMTNFTGDGTVATIPTTSTNAQRFYRVLIQ